MTNVKDDFERWFVKPLRQLEAIPNGDGAFIALASSCFLYERYIQAKVTQDLGKTPDKKRLFRERTKQIALDFQVDEKTATAFWNVIRNGLLHVAMPKYLKGTERSPKWYFHHKFSEPITLNQRPDGDWYLDIQPWKVMDRVIEICLQNINLITETKEFPWAVVEN